MEIKRRTNTYYMGSQIDRSIGREKDVLYR